jgi:hypothetical protein
MCFTFFLDEKSNKKIKTDARFTRKTYARKAKILQTPPFGRQTGVFLRFSHLFFGSTDKVGRSSDLQNFTGCFANNHILLFFRKIIVW